MTLVDKASFTPTPHFRGRRQRVLTRVQVREGAGPVQDALAQDISASGMSAVANLIPPAANAVVAVTLPDGSTLWGIVRWSEGKAFGVEFDPASRERPDDGSTASLPAPTLSAHNRR